jgi:hypothetical protein
MMRRLFILGALGALVLLAATATGASATTWSGSCDLSGETTVLEPYHLTIEGRDYESRASGTCKGTLNGKPYDGPAQTYVDGRMNKPMSCETGISDNVPGWLYFGSGSPNDVGAEETTLYYYIDQFSMGPAVPMYLYGAYRGSAVVVLTYPDVDQSTLEACAGPGLWSIKTHIQTQSLTEVYG